MKTLFFLMALTISTQAWAWGPCGGPCGYPGWGPYMGYGLYGGGYGMVGMGVIQTPSFNYTTTIVQSPPIIVNQQGQALSQPEDRDYSRYSVPSGYNRPDR
jgi:hypothetical protein